MRSEFRFPRATILLMVMIFAGMILAIEAGRDIQVQYSSGANPATVWSALPGAFAFLFLLAGAAGAAGYAILFALQRSGVQQYFKVQTWFKRNSGHY